MTSQKATLILNSQNRNIRNLLKSQTEEQQTETVKNIMFTVFGLANTYTQSKFDRKELAEKSSPTQLIFFASAELIKNKFADLTLNDLKEAFEMYASGDLAEDTKTYYGKFDVAVLGKILKAYRSFKNDFIAKYEKQVLLEKSREEDSDKDEKNEETAASVILTYQKLKETYLVEGIIEEDKILPFWAKILIQRKIIYFTNEEKAEIWAESKEIAKEQLAKSIFSDNHTPAEKISFKKALKKVNEGNQDESHLLAAQRIYGKLLIFKSIINGND